MRTPEPCPGCQGPSSPAHALPLRAGVLSPTCSRGGQATAPRDRGEILPCVNASLGTGARLGLSPPAALQTPQGSRAKLRLPAVRWGHLQCSPCIFPFSCFQSFTIPDMGKSSSSVPQPSWLLRLHLHPCLVSSGQPWGLYLPASACRSLLRELQLWDVLSLPVEQGTSTHRPITAGIPSATKTSEQQGWQPPSPAAPSPGTGVHCLSPVRSEGQGLHPSLRAPRLVKRKKTKPKTNTPTQLGGMQERP